VDDAPENRQLLQVLLGDAGLTVLEAENGAIALGRVADGAPDIVLMDMQMPVMDGVAATRALRDRGCTLPVLALTANAMKGIEHIVRDAGFTGFHTKPIDVDALLQDLALRLGGQRDDSPPEPAAEAEPPPGTALLAQALPPAPSGAALPPMVSRLAHHPRLGKVVARFVQTLPPKLAEMQQALARDDMATLASLAHWLKGAGGSVGFDELFEPAKALDEAAKAHQPDTARAALHDLQALAARIAPVPTGTDQPIKETTT
jgi:CheY-like chemotaxis protein